MSTMHLDQAITAPRSAGGPGRPREQTRGAGRRRHRAGRAVATTDGAPAAPPLRLLLVEDDPADARLLMETLRSHPGPEMDVQQAGTLAAALRSLEVSRPDVVLLDLGLPDATGLDGLLRLQPAALDIPIVLLTGLDDDDLAAAAVEAGAQDYVVKGSVGAGVLVRTVRHAVERHRLQAALTESEEQFRTIAEAAQDAIYRLRLQPEAAFEYLNPVTESISGFSREDFRDNPFLFVERTHPEDLHKLDPGHLPSEGSHSITVRFRHAAGHWIWLEDARSTIVENGRVAGLQGVIRDVTARERTEQALRDALEAEQRATAELTAASDLKSHFLQTVSHELRTPLTSIRGFASTLADNAHRLTDEQLHDIHRRLLRNAERLETLLTDLLDLEQVQHGDVRLTCTDTDLGGLVSKVAAEVEVGDRRLLIDQTPAVATVDRKKVERIIHNLLGNAAKHTPPGTTIRVRCRVVQRRPGEHRDDGDRCIIEVADDGPGIPSELGDRIFEPFEQGPQMQAAASPGTGIGLSIVSRFAGMHGGAATVAPTPGGGATFTVELPVSPGTAGTSTDPGATP